MKKLLFFCFLLFLTFNPVHGQFEEKQISNSSELWLGMYTKYRLSEKLFYYGEYHYRRRENFIQEMAQIYLRFGLTYLFDKNFEITGGIVTPIYWAPGSREGEIDRVVMQYRFWEQLLFVQPVGRSKIYHQLRFEQRWKRDYEVEAPFKLTFRFRYRISLYVPINRDHLMPKTLFFSAYDEIFFQAGKSITYDHLEDNRLFLGLGYIVNENIQIQAGYMWTFRHSGGPYEYEHRHIPRLSFYHSLDFYKRKKENKDAPILFYEF